MALPNLWSAAVEQKASDVHIVTGYTPVFRINGVLTPVGKEKLDAAQVAVLMRKFLSDAQYKRFQSEGDLDCSVDLPDGTRLRINCHMASGAPALAARLIPRNIPTLKDVQMPSAVMDLCRQRDGIVLFTGPTGSGKSTSLAAIIQQMLKEEPINLITLEDPIEFQFRPENGLVRQRELGTDYSTFPEGLKHVLRQDPDVIMVGEMRDLDSIALALTLAETGHLVLATLHTPNTAQSIDRIIDVFPPHQQLQVRMQLSLSMRVVVAQRLVPRKGGGRIANREILVRTPAVSNIIREHRLAELGSVLQTGQQDGMTTFEKDMKRLIKEGLVEAK